MIEKVISECIDKGITDKRAIAKELVKQDPSRTLEQARQSIRVRLGAAGRPLSPKHLEIYNKYMDAISKDNHYTVASKKELKDSRVYIVTTAMNNTPVHRPFWNNVLAYAAYTHAEIHVIAARYSNPTSVFRDKDFDEWCQDVLPYLDAARHTLFPGIHLMSDVKISPTAVTPLSGLNGMSGPESCIFGHTRVHMQLMPVTKGSQPKIMMTTGVCTQPNYTDSKAGKKGEFHHTYGFVIVREYGFHYVTANNDGSFIDYDVMVTDGQVSPAPAVKALILGDIHVAKLTSESLSRIRDRIVGTRAEMVVLHDVLDCESVNPHEEKDAVLKSKRYEDGRNNLAVELDEALAFLGNIKALCDNVVMVRSNHDFMLDRYIANMDWRKDIPNALKYAELLPIALREDGVFPYLARQIGIHATTVDESISVCGIELNLHGDRGANGSRGSAVQFKNLSSKVIVGHSHSPSRLDGCLTVGCQDLDHEYNQGLTSWGIGDVIITANGKVQHIF